MSGYGGNAGTTLQRRGGGGSKSLFYRDLGISPSTGRPPSSSGRSGGGEQSAVAALWRDSISGTDPPPPPCFTLEERFERSTPSEPMTGVEHSYRSPTMMEFSKSPPKTPLSSMSFDGPVTPSPSMLPSPVVPGSGNAMIASTPPPSASWWSPLREKGMFESPSENAAYGVVVQQQSGLLTLPTPREIIRPDSSHRNVLSGDQGEEGDEWITIYGFPGEDTNAVLREFEKCGPIVRHVAGPPNSNWLHIQYQVRLDAQKALLKNGMQLYGALIIGVKRVDPIQKQSLLRKDHRTEFIPKLASVKDMASAQASSRPYYLQAGDAAVKPASTTIASPSKSILSKLTDLIFGV